MISSSLERFFFCHKEFRACCHYGGGVISVSRSPAAWCLRNEGVSSVLLGASNTDQLMENIGAIQVRLRKEQVKNKMCPRARNSPVLPPNAAV